MCGESFQRSAQSSKLGKQNYHHHPHTCNQTLMLALFVFSYLAFNQPRTLDKSTTPTTRKEMEEANAKKKNSFVYKRHEKKVCINYFVINKVIKSYF